MPVEHRRSRAALESMGANRTGDLLGEEREPLLGSLLEWVSGMSSSV